MCVYRNPCYESLASKSGFLMTRLIVSTYTGKPYESMTSLHMHVGIDINSLTTNVVC